jgi:hypothetical protein
MLFSETAGLADDTAKTFVEECNEPFLEAMQKYSMGACTGTIRTMMAVGPVLIPELRFCPGDAVTIQGFAAMNTYVKAHPDVLNGDRLSMLTLAFRDKWPCK